MKTKKKSKPKKPVVRRQTKPRPAPVAQAAAFVEHAQAVADDALLTIDQAATRFAIPSRRMREAIKSGALLGVPFSGNFGWRVRVASVRAWILSLEGGLDVHSRKGRPAGPSAEMADRTPSLEYVGGYKVEETRDSVAVTCDNDGNVVDVRTISPDAPTLDAAHEEAANG